MLVYGGGVGAQLISKIGFMGRIEGLEKTLFFI
jgi:hypothetical protein